MFGIEEMAKGFFPHFFEPQDGSDRLGYVGALPHFSYYMPDLMSTERRAEFFKWYAEERKVYEEGGWVLRDHLERYCLSDCMVLAEGVIRYRNIFMSEIVAPALKGEHSVYKDMKGVEELMGRQEVGDPFVYTTLSSYILALYKALFMPAYTIGITPRPVGVSSLECEQWLRDIEVNTLKRPLEREYKVPEVGQCVDGYDAETKTIYQYHGCWYHGCKRCKTYPTHSSSAALLRARTRWMTCRYRQLGYTIVEKWGCDWKGDIEFRLGMQRDMRGRVEGEAGEEERREQEAARLAGQALDEQVLEDGKVDRRWARSEKERSGDQELWDAEGLVPTQQIKASLPPPLRSVLQGGRVEVFKFYYKVHQPGEKICYVDVNSLYPSVMIRNLYPVGHPRIEKGDNLELKHWHFGFVHCHVEPPKDLAKKVEDFGDKLLFDLNDKGNIWTTEELREAQSLAYKITYVRIRSGTFPSPGTICTQASWISSGDAEASKPKGGEQGPPVLSQALPQQPVGANGYATGASKDQVLHIQRGYGVLHAEQERDGSIVAPGEQCGDRLVRGPRGRQQPAQEQLDLPGDLRDLVCKAQAVREAA
jgi:hypothetical protein